MILYSSSRKKCSTDDCGYCRHCRRAAIRRAGRKTGLLYGQKLAVGFGLLRAAYKRER